MFVNVKKEIAQRHSETLKTLPDECWPGRKSIWSFLTSWMWTKSSECIRHFETIEIDPLWEVPPSKVSDCFLYLFCHDFNDKNISVSQHVFCTIVFGILSLQLRTLCRQRSYVSASLRMFGSLWNAVATHEHRRQNGLDGLDVDSSWPVRWTCGIPPTSSSLV